MTGSAHVRPRLAAANDAVLMPVFSDRFADVAARDAMTRRQPCREAVALDPMRSGGGGIRLATRRKTATA